MKTPETWPQRIKKGNATVTIYRHENKKGEKVYLEFKVAYYDPTGKRRMQTYADYADAVKKANDVTAAVTRGEADTLTLTSADRVAYVRAVDALQPTGLTIDVAAHMIAEAWKHLNGASLVEAARYFAKTHRTTLVRKTVAEVVEEFTTAKEGAGKSDDYLADIRYRCGRFADAFQCSIVDIDGAQIRAFLANLTGSEGKKKGKSLSGRSVNNFKRSITTLFEFAKTRGYVAKDFAEMDGIDDADEGNEAIEIYTPAELVKLLNAATLDFLPALAIAAFAGVRAKEIERLDWSEVQVARGFIEVKAGNAKTAARRLVPVTPNLAQWLAPYANSTGPVWPHSEAWFEESKRETARKAGVPWKHNALRHSFVSYRMAEVKSAAQVALEAGNSPQMVFQNYRELVTEAEAAAWFAISPKAATNIMPMPAVAG